MAARKADTPQDAQEGFFYAINPGGTVVFTNRADFEATWKPAQYRTMKEDEVAPPQMHEVMRYGDGEQGRLAIAKARHSAHGHARFPVPDEPPPA